MERRVRAFAIILCIVASISFVPLLSVSEVNAATSYRILKISTAYYNLLANANSSSWKKISGSLYYLLYAPIGEMLPNSHRWYQIYTRVCATKNLNVAECVDFVKVLSNTIHKTTQTWKKGEQVMKSAGIAVGTVIATFFGKGDGYGGHTAVFAGFTSDGKGFKVFDQNWYGPKIPGSYYGCVGTHIIKTSGSSTSTSNANNYYTVKLPTK